MLRFENLTTQLDDSRDDFSEEDILAVLALVPWARESLATYLTSHRPELEKEILARVDGLLTAA